MGEQITRGSHLMDDERLNVVDCKVAHGVQYMYRLEVL